MNDTVTKTYRIPRQRVSLVREAYIRSEWKSFHNSGELYRFGMEHLFDDADRESFFVLMLDSKNRLIGVNLVSMGSLNSSIVVARECFKPAIVASAAAVIFCHNHPSGDAAPSREDRECTQRLVEAGRILGIRVLDHVIVGEGEHFSFADAGILAQTD